MKIEKIEELLDELKLLGKDHAELSLDMYSADNTNLALSLNHVAAVLVLIASINLEILRLLENSIITSVEN